MPAILVVDDDISARHLIKAVMEQGGRTVREAEDVATAVQTVREKMPDMVITDYNLPDGDGRELAHLLRELAPRLPIVLVSGNRTATGQGRDTVFSAVLSKPFTAAALQSAVTAALKT